MAGHKEDGEHSATGTEKASQNKKKVEEYTGKDIGGGMQGERARKM